VRVLIVDDHPLFRDGLRTALHGVADVEVVGEAGTAPDAVGAAARLRPDVVVMDLDLPGGGGVTATRELLAVAPGTAVLVLSMLSGDDAVFAAMRAGARGYLLKDADRAEILRGLRAAHGGEVVFSAGVAAKVLGWFGGRPSGSPFPQLTDREREVLDLVARGLTNSAIAMRLTVAEKTVRNHVSNVFAKLHVDSRAQAVARARDAGLGHPDPTGGG
jgi:DNA-binding NarL/FixJ family response regulator